MISRNMHLIAYEALLTQYPLAVNDVERYMPSKDIEVIASAAGVPTITKSILKGQTLKGSKSIKEIIVDDVVGKTDEHITLYDANGIEVSQYFGNLFTPFRCGVTVCAAITEISNMLNKSTHGMKVGFIGNGKVNIAVARAIREIFGLDECVVHGSRKNRGKNKELFPNAVVDSNFELLNECNVIISCTSGCDGKDMVPYSRLNRPDIYIALDGGYSLDEDFRRNCESFSDNVKQQLEHYEEEFIFDKERYDLKQLFEERKPYDGKICVYLFGTGFADAVVAEALWRGSMNEGKV